MTAILPAPMRLGTWTILSEGSESVRATITRDRDSYTVRDARGRILGRYPSVQQAVASVTANS